MIDSRIFADVIDEAVKACYAECDEQNLTRPKYLYGQYRSIAKELVDQSGDPNIRGNKYPLILLGLDSQYKEVEIDETQYKVNCNIWILDETKEDWYTSDRFAEVFKKVLYPLYKIFMKQLFASTYVSSRRIEITPETRLFPFWGTNVAGDSKAIINDPLDAMMVGLSDLIINIKC